MNVERLRDEVLALAGGADVLIMAAAVSDFTPASPVGEKIRRSHGVRSLELKPTPDVLEAVREQNSDLFMVGFAATHGDPVADAREKLNQLAGGQAGAVYRYMGGTPTLLNADGLT